MAGHHDQVISLDFSPDGTRLVSGSLDHTLQMWPFVSSPSPEMLCDKITHNMSDEQWDNNVSRQIDNIPVCPGQPSADDAVSLERRADRADPVAVSAAARYQPARADERPNRSATHMKLAARIHFPPEFP